MTRDNRSVIGSVPVGHYLEYPRAEEENKLHFLNGNVLYIAILSIQRSYTCMVRFNACNVFIA